ncbi:MAG: glutamate--cysteine ligase [Proteobacteria bacterium]|nr:MAG: glutamate--cysteine ligase [Pseudomonadota bacterium]
MPVEGAAPIERVAQLVAHHVVGERPRCDWKVGTEHEKFGYRVPGWSPLRYRAADGGPGIRAVLDLLSERYLWEPHVDHVEVVALMSDDGSITLEPGGQLEMSGAPVATIHETEAELSRHVRRLQLLTDELGVRWVWLGYQPVHGLDQIGWMPKRRYRVMRDYLPTRGAMAHHMMKATCTVQANLDYSDEADMGRKLRVANGVASIVTAMFANSPLRDNAPSGYKSFRARIWQDTDDDRAGLLPFVFDGEPPTYERYVEYALDVPLFFIVRDQGYVNCAGLPFRQFLERGFEGHRATMEDWELHLSTLFFEARLKRYIEARSADVVPPQYISALPALWKGILYEDGALDACWDLVKRWTFAQRVQHRADVAKDALAARTPEGYATTELARELMSIARHGLARQAEDAGLRDESIYLDRLARLTVVGKSPADEILDWWTARNPSPQQLLEHLAA